MSRTNGRGIAVVAGGVSRLVAVFTLVGALSGAGVELAWTTLLFLTPGERF
jgi:hypothetical protein